MRPLVAGFLLLLVSSPLSAQPAGKFPPDSLINTQVFPRGTPMTQVVAAMRDATGALGVRCQFCHLGQEGQPLAEFDFASDEKRTKLVARQMMRMVQEINRRLDSLPGRTTPGLQVTCMTCHRGATRPVPLNALVVEAVQAAGVDSAVRAYRALRQRHYGRDAYDFGEPSLNSAALRLSQAKRFDDALAVLKLNEEFFPASAALAVLRGDVTLSKGDTAGAEAAFREALRRDSTNNAARGRLRGIGKQP
jgi:hypothetical protein